MTTRYEVVKAKSHPEAILNSKWKVGQLVVVKSVEAVANTDGTYSVFPICEPIEGKNDG